VRILTLNAGSSSIKAALFSGADLESEWTSEAEVLSASEIPKAVLQILEKVRAPHELMGVAHRIVHGGSTLTASVVIASDVERQIEEAAVLAPLHNPVNLAAVRSARSALPASIPHVAVFDTAFHRTLPDAARLYGGPLSWRDEGIRRYGFHGISVQYCARRAAELLKKTDLKLIVCHLGNGCSLTAVDSGRSVDTTMGMTPLEGPMMGTRAGTVDPGIMLHLLRSGTPVDELEKILQYQSGLLGISGISHDLRVLRREPENPRVKLAIDLFVHQIRRNIGALLPSIRRADAFVFTGGIGEHQTEIRRRVCEAFPTVEIIESRNSAEEDRLISADGSETAVLVIHTREDQEMAREAVKVLGK